MQKHYELLAGLALCLSIYPASATAYKCSDGKNITYATQPCDELGLKSSGIIKNNVTVIPATPVEKTAERVSKKGYSR